MKAKKIKGTFDLLPSALSKNLWSSSSTWREMDKLIHSLAALWGYAEIRTPILESLELFEKTSGETSDICTKEMYRLQDKGNRDLVMRPEGTPAILRALGEAGCFSHGNNFRKRHNVYYLGPMFRYERPQSGRYRQFVQFGIESIGQDSVFEDVEVLSMGAQLLERLSIPYTIAVNFLGSSEELKAYRTLIVEYFSSCADQLSQDSQRRLSSNPLRILDSKEPEDKEWIEKAPRLLDTLGTKSTKRFSEIKALLTELHIPHFVSPFLVRGLDYYTDIVFEFLYEKALDSPSLGGGGRYNNLIASMGYEDLPGCGFAFGFERLVQTAIEEKGLRFVPKKEVFIISLVDEENTTCTNLAWKLRKNDIPIIIRCAEKNLKKALSEANAMGLIWVLIYGNEEHQTQKIQLKNLNEKTSTMISLNHIVEYLKTNI